MTNGPTTSRRAVIYTRVSTGKQAESGLGLVDQLEQTTAAIERRGWSVVEHAEDAGASGKSLAGRAALAHALRLLDAGEADVLVTAKLDRLSRSVMDFGALVERSRRRGWSLLVLDADVDTTTPAGEFMANVLVSAAQYERRLIGARTAAAHRVRKAQGKRAGQAPMLPAEVRDRIANEHRDGRSLRAIADALTADSVPTARGGSWHASTISHVLRSLSVDADLARAGGSA